MQKLIYAEQDEKQRLEKNTGNFNDFPPGWQEISEQEFSRSIYFSHDPEFIEFRQMCRKISDNQPAVSAHLFHYWDGTCIAIVPQRPKEKPYASQYSHVKYFRFGCNHTYQEISVDQATEKGFKHFGLYWHVYECQKCNHTFGQDSSG